MKGPNNRRVATRFTVIAALLLALGSTFADEVLDEESTFDIPDQPLEQALLEFSKQADVQIIMAAETARDLDAEGIHGKQINRDALDRLLADRGLEYSEHSNRTIAVHQSTAVGAGGDSDPGNRAAAGATPRPVMMAQASVEQDQASPAKKDESESERQKRPIEEIIVTGTNIRGIAPDSSPTRIFDREDILASGASTAQDLIQIMPQNFGGGSNADLPGGAPNDANSQFNSVQGTLGSSVNLRGLGSGSTLVLLNGQRIAPSSGIGDFVDISMIPASALERVEVLTDGASSIYGGDAVAGVVNFILRDDFDGAEATFRYGTATEGDLDEYRVGVTGGKTWDTGNALVVYEYFEQDNLGAEDRPFSQAALLPNDLLPRQERHSVLASASKELKSKLELSADFIFSKREALLDFTNAFGQTFHSSPSSEYLGSSAGGSWKVSETWFADFSVAYGDLRSDTNLSGTSLNIMRRLDSDIWTADAKASGTVVRLPGGDLKLAIGGHYREEAFTNLNIITATTEREADRNVYAFFSEAFIPIVGPNNAVSGIERLELNVSGRFDDYSDFGSTANPKVGILWSPFDELRLRSSYSTSFNPPPLGRTGATDFRANAFRTSRLNSVFGLTPGDPSIADVVVLLASGTAKGLDPETSSAFTSGLDLSQEWGRHHLEFAATYFDIDLKNRLGTTPVPGNRPAADAHNIAFTSPELFPEGSIVLFPPQDLVDSFLDSLDMFASVGGAVPSDAEIINIVAVVRNLSRTRVSGFDFNLAYTFDSDMGPLSLGLDGTYLRDYKQQAAVTIPAVDRLDTLYNPASLKLRGRVGYAYSGFAANLFINYTDDYRVDSTAGGAPINSWTTVDLSMSYDTRERPQNNFLANTIVRLSIINLLNEDPPSTPGAANFLLHGFDATNASPLGRFIALDLTKRF